MQRRKTMIANTNIVRKCIASGTNIFLWSIALINVWWQPQISKEDGNDEVYDMAFAMFSQIVVEDGAILLIGCC